MIVALATFTSDSSLPVNGSESEPNGETPTLAELLLFFSVKFSCTALTKAIVRRPRSPRLAQTTVNSTSACASGAGWKILRPRTCSAVATVMT